MSQTTLYPDVPPLLGPVVESKSKRRKSAPGQQLHLIEREISTIGYDQNAMLSDICQLYAPAGFEVDATFGYGGFYQVLPRPKYCFDVLQRVPGVTIADSRILPLPSSSIKTLMFDPPFVVTNHKESDEYVMGAKYGGYRTITELREHYNSSLVEFARVVRPRGIVVFKCQDFVHGRSNYFIHDEVLSMARAAGFRPVDLFILCARNRFKGGMLKQNHARKYHSYFWVFRRMQRDNKNAPDQESTQ